MTGEEIFHGRYRLLNRVGQGMVSTVYRALDLHHNNEQVAIKFLDTRQPNQYTQEYFRREITSLRRLNSPNIVSLRDSGYDDTKSAFYLVLDYLPKTLNEIISEHGNGDSTWIWPIVRTMAEALGDAHAEGIIHRDIKPSNILFDEGGNAKLSDFGISRLKFDVCIGVTLSKFLSPGYAAPEQRLGEEAETWTDIYSLGAVIYQALSHKVPSAEGPTPNDLQNLSVSDPLKELLSHMLARNPNERIRTVQEFKTALDACKLPEIIPAAFLVVTDRAITDLISLGVVLSSDFAPIKEKLIDLLGGENIEELPTLLTPDGKFVEILSDPYQLTCTVDLQNPSLVLIGVRELWQPIMQRREESSMRTRVMWEPIRPGAIHLERPQIRVESQKTVENLLNYLTSDSKKKAFAAKGRDDRRSFVELWERFLNLERQTREKSAPKLKYDAVKMDGDAITFTLAEPIPDGLNWLEGTPIGVGIDERYTKYIGRLSEMRGNEVYVLRDTLGIRFDRLSKKIPPKGKITVSLAESLAVLNREQQALGLFRSGTMVNHNMSQIIIEPARARFETTLTEPNYFHSWLESDKREAVKGALRAQDLFLIQGPPGTGKTTVIAELIAQILKAEPNSRILVTSQSNVPVNHALAQVAKIKGLPNINMVRVGREENIGKGAEKWQLEEQLRRFRESVIGKCDLTLDELRQKRRKQRAVANPSNDTNTEQAPLDEWIDEARTMLADLKEYESEAARIQGQIRRGEGNDTDKLALDSLVSVVQSSRAELSQHIASISELLPSQYRPVKGAAFEEDLENIQRAYTKSQRDIVPEPLEAKLIALLNDWKTVVGNASDFEEFLIKRANLIGATCLFSAGPSMAEEVYDWVIVDEAGRATAPELLAPMVRGRRAVLVGDERQLPPFIDQEFSDQDLVESGFGENGRASLEKSLFQAIVERASVEKPEIVQLLNTQHRMHPAIGNMISQLFYSGKLVSNTDREKLAHGFTWLPRPIVWYSTSSMVRRAESKRGKSSMNLLETHLIRDILVRMEKDSREQNINRSVGVISGYDAQIQELAIKVAPDDKTVWNKLDIEVDTVDGFQGRECDVIIYSTVRSNKNGNIGFLRDRRRINVALSRARQLVILVGDLAMMQNASLSKAANPFSDVIPYLQDNPLDCSIIDVMEEEWLVK